MQQDGSILPTLKYLHCKYKTQFEFLFSKIGVNVTEDKLKLLAIASDTGSDKKGVVKDANGKPIYFSVEDVLKNIKADQIENNMCAI